MKKKVLIVTVSLLSLFGALLLSTSSLQASADEDYVFQMVMVVFVVSIMSVF